MRKFGLFIVSIALLLSALTMLVRASGAPKAMVLAQTLSKSRDWGRSYELAKMRGFGLMYLLRLARSERAFVRENGLHGLARIDHPLARGAFYRGMMDDSAQVRSGAYSSLFLQSDDVEECALVLRTLDRCPADVWLAGLHDEEREVRSAAALLLFARPCLEMRAQRVLAAALLDLVLDERNVGLMCAQTLAKWTGYDPGWWESLSQEDKKNAQEVWREKIKELNGWCDPLLRNPPVLEVPAWAAPLVSPANGE